MSELQLGLLAIGLCVLAGVFGYNKWQETRLRRKTEAAFGAVHEDVLMGAGPLTDFTESVTPASRLQAVEVSSGVADHRLGLPEDSPPAYVPAQALTYAALNAFLDYIGSFDLAAPLPGKDIATRIAGLIDDAQAGYVHWEALDPSGGSWRTPLPEGRYDKLRAGLQLADQGGPRSAVDVEAFHTACHEIALALNAGLEMEHPAEAAARAEALQRFSEEYDVQVGLSVITDERHTISGTKIRGVAESGGFVLGKDGRYHRYDETGVELYTLVNLEPMPFHPETLKELNTRGVTLLLNVPRAPGLPTTFRSYSKFARQLAEALDGELVDDNRQPIGQPAIDAVASQLGAIHQAMAARGLAAGSSAARRLFA